VLNDDWEKEAGREREKKEGCRGERNVNFLLIFEFAEELQCSANLLSIVAPHHFAEPFVEPTANDFWLWLNN
jgi:hypothetical protein